jgi:aspartate racemase
MSASQEVVAVIGGLGPLASAAFVNSVYERARGRSEQEMPRLLLWSDPLFPDRTRALAEGRQELLARHLERAIRRCRAAGAERVVICCMTVHAVLPLLPAALRARVVSLVEVLLAAALTRRRPQLLLTSLGTRRARVLEQHPLWEQARAWLRWPEEQEHEQVHAAIYALKTGQGPARAGALVRELLARYGLRSFAAACTELHLVTRSWAERPPAEWLDPLDIVAARLAGAPLDEPAHEVELS